MMKANVYSAVRLLPVSFLLLTILASGCSDKRVINERTVFGEIRYHLESNPEQETAELTYGEVRFSKKSDSLDLELYHHLADYGYVNLELLKERRKFLSKDSTFTYVVELKDKSIPYVLNKTEKKATVITYYYELDESQPASLEQTGKNRAKATVTLTRKETDFSMLAKKNRASNASFIKKTYNFRFDENSGWRIAK